MEGTRPAGQCHPLSSSGAAFKPIGRDRRGAWGLGLESSLTPITSAHQEVPGPGPPPSRRSYPVRSALSTPGALPLPSPVRVVSAQLRAGPQGRRGGHPPSTSPSSDAPLVFSEAPQCCPSGSGFTTARALQALRPARPRQGDERGPRPREGKVVKISLRAACGDCPLLRRKGALRAVLRFLTKRGREVKGKAPKANCVVNLRTNLKLSSDLGDLPKEQAPCPQTCQAARGPLVGRDTSGTK